MQFRIKLLLYPPFYAISRTQPARNSFSRLLTAHTNFHSRLTFSLPRKLKNPGNAEFNTERIPRVV
jgi:hypothetical protein